MFLIVFGSGVIEGKRFPFVDTGSRPPLEIHRAHEAKVIEIEGPEGGRRSAVNASAQSGSLVLASASPRRRDLLEAAGYRFRLCPVQVVELSVHDHGHGVTKPLMVVEENARRKAIAAQASVPGDPSHEATGVSESPERAETYVLAADTILILDDGWIGKPGDREQAVALLKRLAGRAHEVATGVVLLGPGVDLTFVEVTRVLLKPLTLEEIRAYHRAVDPLDKAGGYDINQPGPISGGVVASIEGSYSNVMGLPMERLRPILDGVLGR